MYIILVEKWFFCYEWNTWNNDDALMTKHDTLIYWSHYKLQPTLIFLTIEQLIDRFQSTYGYLKNKKTHLLFYMIHKNAFICTHVCVYMLLLYIFQWVVHFMEQHFIIYCFCFTGVLSKFQHHLVNFFWQSSLLPL